MARISRIAARDAGFSVKLAHFFTRKGMENFTGGRQLDSIIEPLEVWAHVPGLLKGYGKLEQATSKLDRLTPRHRALAELRAATLVQCEYCIDLGSQISRAWGLSDDELLALPRYATSDLFDDLDRLVLDYSTGMCRTPVEVPDELFAALRRHFDEPTMVELTHVVAIENLRGRFNLAMGIGAAGFSEGLVCALPATPDALTTNRN
jgi:AhpD family alkylhydroperoxidase